VGGYLLLVIYLLVLFALFYHFRAGFRRLNRSKWLFVGGLSIAALLLSQLFPYQLPALSSLYPNLVTREQLTLLAPLPYLFAGVALNPAAALLVGLFGGLGRALGESHQYYDIFNVAFAAVIGSVLMRQRYVGPIYQWLRHPIVAGGLAQFCLAVLIGLSAAFNALTGFLAAVDYGIVIMLGNLPSLVIEGLLMGGVVEIILRLVPQWRPNPSRVTPPAQRSLDQNLATNFALSAVVLVLLSIILVYLLFSRVTTARLVEQMTFNIETVESRMPDLSRDWENTLAQYGNGVTPLGENAKRQELSRVESLSSQFSEILLVQSGGSVLANSAGSEPAVELSATEVEAVVRALNTNAPALATAEDGTNAISVITPVRNTTTAPEAVVGRVAPDAINDLLSRLVITGQGVGAAAGGAVVDIDGNTLLSAGSHVPARWQPSADLLELPQQPATADGDGIAYQHLDPATGQRFFGYYTPLDGPDRYGRYVMTTIPASVVLGQTLWIVAPITLLLTAVAGIFYWRFSRLGRNLTQPISRLIEKSKEITAAASSSIPVVPTVETTTRGERPDEIGQLSVAFSQMQRALKQRLDDLMLLLNVSHEVASTVDINQGMPAILQGVLRGTGAAGSRAVVRNPNNPYPLIFAEGPAAESLAALDRAVMKQVRQPGTEEVSYGRPEEICEALGITHSPVAALFAIPLRSHAKFQGVLYLGYRQPHYVDQTERNLLHTLAGQATVLVENAHLYAMAEGGRRRLAAILASTSNAIVVTDQTERVLYLNVAMEKAFELSANEAIGRPVGDISLPPELVDLLSMVKEHPARLELALGSRTFLADASTIVDRNGMALGRVAVLHDVTHFKEVDRLKSEFLTGVSHDLRSPLTIMRNNATSLLLLDDLPEASRERVKKIQLGINQMSAMVDDVLDLARIEAGVDFERREVRLESLLRQAADEQRPNAQQAGIELAVEVGANIPLVRADQNLVKRAITNLLANGIKYAPNSGRMILRAEPQNGEVVISVRDNGPGIAPEEQLRLFEKFYRAERPGIRRVKGSGLGLALVKSIAEQHGGRAWCISQPGQGSTFYIALPLE
jgi:PAS domain S-box-containing protein